MSDVNPESYKYFDEIKEIQDDIATYTTLSAKVTALTTEYDSLKSEMQARQDREVNILSIILSVILAVVGFSFGSQQWFYTLFLPVITTAGIIILFWNNMLLKMVETHLITTESRLNRIIADDLITFITDMSYSLRRKGEDIITRYGFYPTMLLIISLTTIAATFGLGWLFLTPEHQEWGTYATCIVILCYFLLVVLVVIIRKKILTTLFQFQDTQQTKIGKNTIKPS